MMSVAQFRETNAMRCFRCSPLETSNHQPVLGLFTIIIIGIVLASICRRHFAHDWIIRDSDIDVVHDLHLSLETLIIRLQRQLHSKNFSMISQTALAELLSIS
jgi:hypothetical protein